MDGLPDELMLMILGHVDEADTLLDAVPLVCRRWLELSRDPRAWAAVSVVECGTLNEARAVLRAPHLRRLEISCLSEGGDSRMQSALRRSSVTVRELLQVHGNVNHPTFLALLWRSREQLRELVIDLCYHKGQVTITTNSGPLNLIGVLAQMRRLEVLTIEGPMEETNLPYNGELANRLPCLRRLEMRHFLHEAMLSDLLRGAACSLRVVDLHLQPLNDALRGALELCTELRRLQVELNDADVVRCMPGLHTLILYSHPTHNALQRLQNSLSHCSPLVSLRHLELTLELYNVHPGYWTHLAHVLTDLAAVALGTTHLRITIDTELGTEVVQNAEQCVEQVVAHLPRLQVAELHPCGLTLLHRLAAMEDLRVVNATFVCPTEQREQWESATNDFYNRRPDLKANVDLFDFGFGFQSVWKKYKTFRF